jgi:hypothetical protein
MLSHFEICEHALIHKSLPTLLLLLNALGHRHGDGDRLAVELAQRVLQTPLLDLAVPLVFDFGDAHLLPLAGRVDQHLAVDCLLAADAFDSDGWARRGFVSFF